MVAESLRRRPVSRSPRPYYPLTLVIRVYICSTLERAFPFPSNTLPQNVRNAIKSKPGFDPSSLQGSSPAVHQTSPHHNTFLTVRRLTNLPAPAATSRDVVSASGRMLPNSKTKLKRCKQGFGSVSRVNPQTHQRSKALSIPRDAKMLPVETCSMP